MSDPIKDLENFDPQGLPMNPLTPSEIRRRGDRMRRRRNGVMAVGAAAAVAVIATSGVFISNAVDQGQEPAPASPSQTEDVEQSEIPADFPLAAGVKGATESDGAVVSGLDYCGSTPLADLDPVDVRSIELSGGETAISRTVYLLDGPESALAAHGALVAAAEECADDPDNAGDIAVHGDGEGWPGTTITLDRARGEQVFEPAVDVVDVVSAGPALLVTSTATYPTGDINQNVADQRAADNRVMTAMAEFGEYAAPSDSTGSTGGSSVTAIPDDFALGGGWPEDSQAESGKNMGLQGPNRTLPDLKFLACGERWQEPEYADRLRADWNNVEDYRSRQLTTYADAAAAEAAVESLIAQQQACPEDPVRDDGYVNNREVREVAIGDQAWAILERDTMDGNPSPYGESTVVVRVGAAVLVIRGGGHGGYPSGDGQKQIDTMLAEAAHVITSMCEFTEDGC